MFARGRSSRTEQTAQLSHAFTNNLTRYTTRTIIHNSRNSEARTQHISAGHNRGLWRLYGNLLTQYTLSLLYLFALWTYGPGGFCRPGRIKTCLRSGLQDFTNTFGNVVWYRNFRPFMNTSYQLCSHGLCLWTSCLVALVPSVHVTIVKEADWHDLAYCNLYELGSVGHADKFT